MAIIQLWFSTETSIHVLLLNKTLISDFLPHLLKWHFLVTLLLLPRLLFNIGFLKAHQIAAGITSFIQGFSKMKYGIWSCNALPSNTLVWAIRMQFRWLKPLYHRMIYPGYYLGTGWFTIYMLWIITHYDIFILRHCICVWNPNCKLIHICIIYTL